MATKVDNTAQKKKRNMILLGVGGAILLLLAVVQGPKLFGGSGSSSEPAAGETTQATAGATATPAPGTTGTAGSTATPTTVPGAVPGTTGVGLPAPTASSIYVAGVAVTPAVRPPVMTGQLWSFSRFKAKDPFVPKVTDDNQPVASAAVAPPSPPPAPVVQAPASTGATATAAAGPAKWATVTVNGRQSAVQANGKFPADKTFVLVSLKRGTATVAPAGGKLAKGKSVTLTFGNPVTLVDAATGKRYTLELVYTGPKPEQVTAFSG
ncbi:MAG TPA: hypothetical protein VFR43_08280 [Gaiellaceae bacterium]|nr:hypothetical protein [Gaiellaceae bacterium]